MRRLYSGEAIRVFADDLDAPRTLVTFTNWAQKPPRRMIYPSLAQAAGMGFVGFVALQNHWWQTPEFEPALRAVESRLAGHDDVTMFGASMGGAGALLASQMIAAERVMAVAPPVIVDQKYAPFEKRFESVAHLTRVIYHLGQTASPDTETVAVYDPFLQADVMQLRYLEGHGRAFERWPLPFSGHTPLLALKRAGLLRDFNTAFFIENAPKRAKQILRSARHTLGTVQLRNLQRRTYGRRRYLEPGYVSDLTALMSEFPNDVEHYEERGLAYERQGQLSLALQDFVTCVQLNGRKRYRRHITRLETQLAEG